MSNVKVKTIDGYSVGQLIKTYCNKCQKNINHLVVKSIKEESEEIDIDYKVNAYTDYQIIKCAGCDEYTFREDKYFSEYCDYDSNGKWEELYPTSILGNKIEKEYDNLPYNLENIYNESVKCFNNDQYILCATGIRSILEGICINRKITKGNIVIKKNNGTVINKVSTKLDGKINGLYEAGIINISQMSALHELRFLGNKAVHELDIPSKEDLEIAFDIIEHILLDIYDLSGKSKKLETKRLTKKT